jgi:transcriptional regulator with XRE-family HTH domain
MDELAKSLREARSSRGMTLEAASGAAKISTAYLHKLEAGRVQTPSPHVLRRLAAVFGTPYPALMTLAGYLDQSEPTAGSKGAPAATPGKKEKSVKQSPTSAAATNAEIVRLLQAVLAELGELKRGQAELATKLGKPTPPKTTG